MVKGYLSYVLRLWQAGSGPKAAWRASVEGISTGECRAFADLDDLFHFLRQQAASFTLSEEETSEERALGRSDGAASADAQKD
jgi:hypothetical protein